jgi:long-chain fatty acid transport protein
MKSILIILSACLPTLLSAQGFQVNLQGQSQQAMGGAATALPQDGSALFFNPGSVSFLKHNSFSAGVSPVISNTQFTDLNTSTAYKTNSKSSYPFTGYIVLGRKESRMKYGIAVYTPFGSGISWQDAWAGRFVITDLKLKTVYVQPTISYKISEKLGIGAGFVYGVGKLDLASDLPITDEDGNYGTLNLEGSGRGAGFNAGIYYQPLEKLSFGVNYRSSLKLKVDEGRAIFNVGATMASNFPSGPVSTTLNLPNVLSLGTAYKASTKLTIAFEATRVGWKTYDTLNYDFQNNTAYVIDMKMSRRYQNTYSYRVGTQYAPREGVNVRAGLKYLSTPVQNGHVTPEVPDADHLSYSTGFGLRFNKHITADASLTYEYIMRTDSNAEIQLNGKYQTHLFIPGISVSYSF